MCWGLWTHPMLQNYLEVCRCVTGVSAVGQVFSLNLSATQRFFKGKLLTDSNLCVQIQESWSWKNLPFFLCVLFPAVSESARYCLLDGFELISLANTHRNFVSFTPPWQFVVCFLTFIITYPFLGGTLDWRPTYKSPSEVDRWEVQKQISTGSDDLGWALASCALCLHTDRISPSCPHFKYEKTDKRLR